MPRDHVCDMEVDESSAAGRVEYKGETFYFCSTDCKKKFAADPEKYVSLSDTSQT